MPTVKEFCKKNDKDHHYCISDVKYTRFKRFPAKGGMSDSTFKKLFPIPYDVYYAPIEKAEGLWRCEHPLPRIGDKVEITVNGLGTGTVENYFIEWGWLGITVKLDNEPDWHKVNCPDFPYAMVFGTEIA
jgi:hypothetical protein